MTKDHINLFHNPETESTVIGAMLIDKDAFFVVSQHINSSHFQDSKFAAIYDACETISLQGGPIDLLTVSNALRASNRIEQVGGMKGLAELTQRVASAANIEAHARIILYLSIRRKLRAFTATISERTLDPNADTIKLIEQSDTELTKLNELLQGRGDSTATVLGRVTRNIEAAQKEEREFIGIPSGLYELDRITLGFKPSNLIIVAARPSMGKTSLVMNMAQFQSSEFGKHILIFSYEMSADELMLRMVSSVTGIDSRKLQTGKGLRHDEMNGLYDKLKKVNTDNLKIVDDTSLTVRDVRSRCHIEHRKRKLDCIIIDYIGLIPETGPNRREQLGKISRGLKLIAKELNVPVIALSQLSRALETRDNKRPKLSDLRETGDIEQDADVVMFVHRDDYYEKNREMQPDIVPAELIVAKHRGGALGCIDATFEKSTTTFTSGAKFSKQSIF